MVIRATAVFVMAVLGLVAACTPAGPTPTPTPAWVLATAPEHLVGVWRGNRSYYEGVQYQRFEADGTICHWWWGGRGFAWYEVHAKILV